MAMVVGAGVCVCVWVGGWVGVIVYTWQHWAEIFRDTWRHSALLAHSVAQIFEPLIGRTLADLCCALHTISFSLHPRTVR